MRTHRTALLAGCLVTTSLLAGAAPALAQNPDTNDAGTGISSIDDNSTDYGLAQMACLSDDRTARLLGATGHVMNAADQDTDDDYQLDATPSAYIIAAGLTATTAAGAYASG